MSYKKFGITLIAVIFCLAIFAFCNRQTGSKPEMLFKLPPSSTTDSASRYFWLDANRILALHQEGWDVNAKICTLGGQCAPDSELSDNLSRLHSTKVVSSMTINSKADHILLKDQHGKFLVGDIKFNHSRPLPTGAVAVWDFSGDHAIILSNDERYQIQLSGAYLTTCTPQGSCSDPVRGSFMPAYYDYIGSLSSDWIVGMSPAIGDGDLTVLQADPHQMPQQRNILFLKTPADTYGPVSARVSPDGKQIAWAFGEAPPLLGISALNQTQYMRLQPTSIMSIWISGPAAENMHKIYEKPGLRHTITDIAWSPDQRWISYISENAVWRIQAK